MTVVTTVTMTTRLRRGLETATWPMGGVAVSMELGASGASPARG